jgi:hypothetical protein
LVIVLVDTSELPESKDLFDSETLPATANTNTMAADSKRFDADIDMGDAALFAPLLSEDLSTLPPPFMIPVPLTDDDFPRGHTFLADLETVQDFFKDGYDNNFIKDKGKGDDKGTDGNESEEDNMDPLTSSQYIRGTAQIMAAIMQGIQSTFPLSDVPQFLRSLGPDDLDSLKVFTEAAGALNRYLTDPTAQSPNSWQQCLRCLQVSHTTVTEDDWWAHMNAANQNTTTVRHTIINRTIRNVSNEALKQTDEERGRAWDQIVTMTINANPPPFDADPRILEFIQHEAERLRADTKACTLDLAKQRARVLHDQQVQVIKNRLDEDLAFMRDETDKALDRARELAAQELANLRAQAKVDRKILKAEIKEEATKTACKERTARPKKRADPLTSTTRSRAVTHSQSRSSSVIPATPVMLEMPTDASPPSDFTLPGEATQAVQMMTDPDSPTRSVTPKANPPTDKLDDILNMMHKGFKNMGNIVDSKLEKALAPINARLHQLEGTPCQLDDFPNWGQGDVNINSGAVDYTTPEQYHLLHLQQESKEFEAQYAEYEEEDCRRLEEEERHRERWKTATDEEKREMIVAEGGDPDVEMTNSGGCANPIYIPDSQESAFPPRPAPQPKGRQPILGLEWKTVGKKQINALPTIGGSYAARAGKTATAQPNPPAKTTQVTQAIPAFTSERLHA